VTFPTATEAQRAAFSTRGWVSVENAIPQNVLDDLQQRADRIRDSQLAMDWSHRDGVSSSRPEDQVLQGMLELDWLDWTAAPFHAWTLAFASALMGRPVRLWYNQLLDKPPLVGAPTHWHQDGALMGEGDGNRLISCWMPLDTVDEHSGCMHFVDGGHQDGEVAHVELGTAAACGRGPCIVDESRVVAVPLSRGGVTFHHGLMPHMTRANRSNRWRQVVIQRFFVGVPPGSRAE
jgi:ectoine hydroxylase-related dioxygenase (phytanoyl-CoA dioxygenase family)